MAKASYGTYDSATLDRTRQTIRNLTQLFIQHEQTKLQMEKDVWEKQGVDSVMARYIAETQGQSERPGKQERTPPAQGKPEAGAAAPPAQKAPATPEQGAKPEPGTSIESSTSKFFRKKGIEAPPVEDLTKMYDASLKARAELSRYGARGAAAMKQIEDDFKTRFDIWKEQRKSAEFEYEQALKEKIEIGKIDAKTADEPADRALSALKVDKEKYETYLNRLGIDLNQVLSEPNARFWRLPSGKITTDPDVADNDAGTPITEVEKYRMALDKLYAYMDEKRGQSDNPIYQYEDPYLPASERRNKRMDAELSALADEFKDIDIATLKEDSKEHTKLKDTAARIGVPVKELQKRLVAYKGSKKPKEEPKPTPKPDDKDGKAHPDATKTTRQYRTRLDNLFELPSL